MSNVYEGDTFKIVMHRYSDPERLNAARNAAIYLGKPDRDNIRRPLSIVRLGHVPEVFRGEMAEFEFIDVDKTVYDHLITYTTRNMRVTGGNRALTSKNYTLPSDNVKSEWDVNNAVKNSMLNYKFLLINGETPQVARAAMPVSAKMNPFVFQFNFVTLMQALFPQRIWEKGAQGNTVKVVQGMFELVHRVDPELWDLVYDQFGTPAVEWKIARRKLEKMTGKDFLDIMLDKGIPADKPIADTIRELFGQQKSMWE